MLLRRALTALAVAAAAVAAHSTAGSQTVGPLDPIARMLLDRGVLSPAEAGLAADVRSAVAAPVDGRSAQRLREGASNMIVTALNFLDVPYRSGGKTEIDGFDCSGFTRHVFRQIGLALPPSADDQANAQGLVAVERDELRPGDLVFFNTLQRAFSHVGIYVGNDRFIHAPRAGSQVRVDDMRKSYWLSRFTGGRRVAAWTEPLLVSSH